MIKQIQGILFQSIEGVQSLDQWFSIFILEKQGIKKNLKCCGGLCLNISLGVFDSLIKISLLNLFAKKQCSDSLFYQLQLGLVRFERKNMKFTTKLQLKKCAKRFLGSLNNKTKLYLDILKHGNENKKENSSIQK